MSLKLRSFFPLKGPFDIEDLRIRKVDTTHGIRLTFYADDSVDAKAILSHVLASETGIPVSRLLRLVEQDGKLYVLHR